jgi:hypothetical protein
MQADVFCIRPVMVPVHKNGGHSRVRTHIALVHVKRDDVRVRKLFVLLLN